MSAARINCGTTPYRGAHFSGLLPFFPKGFQTNSTQFPVIWFAKNGYEGNVAGLNHVIIKYPRAKSYHRFVVSEPMSHFILNHPLTTSWVSITRFNEFKKYTNPVHIDDMQETRCFLRCTRNGVKSTNYLSMTSENGIDAKVEESVSISQYGAIQARKKHGKKTLARGGLALE